MENKQTKNNYRTIIFILIIGITAGYVGGIIDATYDTKAKIESVRDISCDDGCYEMITIIAEANNETIWTYDTDFYYMFECETKCDALREFKRGE